MVNKLGVNKSQVAAVACEGYGDHNPETVVVGERNLIGDAESYESSRVGSGCRARHAVGDTDSEDGVDSGACMRVA